jgi:hypothetical protein
MYVLEKPNSFFVFSLILLILLLVLILVSLLVFVLVSNLLVYIFLHDKIFLNYLLLFDFEQYLTVQSIFEHDEFDPIFLFQFLMYLILDVNYLIHFQFHLKIF